MERKAMDHIRREEVWSKSELRKHILTVRDNLSAEDRKRYQEQIGRRIVGHRSYQESQGILAYASYRSEVDTMTLIGQALADGKFVFVPRVADGDMEFWQITSLGDLHTGYRGIPEPVEKISFPQWIAERDGNGEEKINPWKRQEQAQVKIMMWMPGTVFDRERHRIGYGKGFYDRYLGRLLSERSGKDSVPAENFQLVTAALAYHCQVIQKIPYEPHDIRPDLVVTEEETLQ